MNEQQQELYEKLLKKVNEFCLGQAAEDVIAAIDDLVDSYETPKVEILSEPLEALERIIETFVDKDSEDIKTVRIALKEGEMEHTLRIRLENANYELVRENEKNKKALEIIKKYNYALDIHNALRLFITKRDYKLLKEVLGDEILK